MRLASSGSRAKRAICVYECSLEKHVPVDHLLRSIDRFVDLVDVPSHLTTFYSTRRRFSATASGSGPAPSASCRRTIYSRIASAALGRATTTARSRIWSERLTGVLLDRLTHHVHILQMNRESYRLRQCKHRRRSRRSDDSQPQAG